MPEVAHLFVQIDGIWVPLHRLPCWKCKWRYSFHCPKCTWNADGRYNTYSGKVMTQEQADRLNDGKEV